MSRNLWPTLAVLFGLLAAGSIGYIVGQLAPLTAPQIMRVPSFTVISVPTVTTTWRGLHIAPEHRCAPYEADDYSYSAGVEAQIVAQQDGRIYGPYTGRWFESQDETDIEHIVARSEAHDSGLCAADADRRRAFAGDLRNLTLSAPEVNRHDKAANDAAAWLPPLNQCWFAARVVEVRQAYQLTIDQAEADALDRVLAGCASTAMVVTEITAAATSVPAATAPPSRPRPRRAGMPWRSTTTTETGGSPVPKLASMGSRPCHRGHPAYEFMRDGDGETAWCASDSDRVKKLMCC